MLVNFGFRCIRWFCIIATKIVYAPNCTRKSNKGKENRKKNDKDFAKKFKEDPAKALEEVSGIDLPEDKINDIITAVKTKIKLDDSEIFGKIKGLFG